MSFLRYIFGPKLYMEYGLGSSQINLMWNIGFYTSPLLATFLYRRGYFVMDSITTLAKISTSIGLIVIISMVMRGLGRTQSASYTKMIKAMELLKSPKTEEEGKRALRLFDFEFKSWAVDFDVKTIQSDDKKNKVVLSKNSTRSFHLATIPCEIAAYVAIHSFGIRMMYPGSIKLLQSYMRPMLVAGRAKLIEEENGRRYKVRTIDSNDIDTIFVDNRIRSSNGKTLVICSEGNAGFYEIGIMGTPLSLKYSVLGWNHPGFEGSTGKPYPDEDKNAIEAVVQFAIYQLGFAVEDIILYGWSIGGYSSLWAASCYPDVKGVILDATFDDVLYLAQPRMPASLSGIVRIAIREFCNLNNAELAQNYHGPISLIRRTEDEVIAEDNQLETNRGNFLALSILKYRYPHIYKTAQLNRCKQILAKPIETRNFTTADDELCLNRLIIYASDQGKKYPMDIGEDYSEDVRHSMSDFLLRKHFRDFKSTHCTQLPAEYFNIPFDIPVEHGFKAPEPQELKAACDEKQLILQLARLYVTSPERIVLLLTSISLRNTCERVSDILHNINQTLTECVPLAHDNLYMRLTCGLDYFNTQICLNTMHSDKSFLRIQRECISELHEDLLECEGPPDWFEKSNKEVVCEYYQDIINCNYIKAAMLCGLKPAVMLRTFTSEVINRILTFKCKLSRSLPYVDNPMPARGVELNFLNMFILTTLSILLFLNL
ncbi:hypothetical protein DOY81_003399 [Sarcophaga bullata]|nr:hypothetical protein DOY81_003399 [Sarcophaga bullata]